jgi:hypothetical protein
MRWKHGKDHLAPLISVEKPTPLGEIRRKAKAFEAEGPKLKKAARVLRKAPAAHESFEESIRKALNRANDKAVLADVLARLGDVQAIYSTGELTLEQILANHEAFYGKKS